MKLYLSSTPTPSRVLGILQLLQSRPGGQEQRKRLGELFHPKPLRPTKGVSQAFDELTAALAELGLLEEIELEAGRTLTSALAAPGTDLAAILPCRIAPLLLQPEHNGEPNRLARVIAWFLAQPVAGVPSSPGPIKSALGAVRDRPGWDFEIDSDLRLDMVVSWAKYLGLLRQIRPGKGEGIVADPTQFLRRNLETLLPGDEPVPIHRFRADLGRLCPVLDGGVVREQALATFGLDHAENRLSSALSFALRRLRKDRAVEFSYLDDARPENLLLLDSGERLTTIRRVRGEVQA